jgi:integrase/recombinase XerC
MASLYRKPVMITDKATGRKVKQRSKKWWGQYKDADGRLRRKPLARDKTAAKAMLNEIVKRVEREKAGPVDPTEEQRKRPLSVHLKEFESYLVNRDVTQACTDQRLSELRRMIEDRRWRMIADISAGDVLEFLGRLRRRHGLSPQTCNKYLSSAKQFTRWLVRDRRTPMDPLAHLSRLNDQTDRRHDRRALSAEEFSRLVEAARAGKRIEGVSGRDRAMIYVLAAWTGFRRNEIGSLTVQSFRLHDDPPTAGVPPKVAQTLARHADIRLTLGLYTHVELHDQAAAIESLPAPPVAAAIKSLPAPPVAAAKNETVKTPHLRLHREEECDGQDSAA